MVDVSDTEADMQQFMADGGFGFPVMLSGDDAAKAYGVVYIPAVFLIDAEGRLVRSLESPTASDLSAAVDGL